MCCSFTQKQFDDAKKQNQKAVEDLKSKVVAMLCVIKYFESVSFENLLFCFVRKNVHWVVFLACICPLE